MTKLVQGSFLLKSGGVALTDGDTKMNLFFTSVASTVNMYTDDNLILSAETKEFGVEMHAGHNYSLIQKMDSSEVFWNMRYEKFPIGSELEYKLDLTVNPIKLVYEASFIRELIKFFSTEFNSALRE